MFFYSVCSTVCVQQCVFDNVCSTVCVRRCVFDGVCSTVCVRQFVLQKGGSSLKSDATQRWGAISQSMISHYSSIKPQKRKLTHL